MPFAGRTIGPAKTLRVVQESPPGKNGWKQIDELFKRAIQLGAEERAAFLARECAGDRELREEVESLLAAHDSSSEFMDAPVFDDAIKLLQSDDDELKAGDRIGNYEVVREIGRGGMGAVYLARDIKLGRKVALKFVPGEFGHDQQSLSRFEQEARLASSLNHPNICTIHEVNTANDRRRFIVMEFVEGITLAQRLAAGPVPVTETLEIVRQVGSALSAAHNAGIIHRDLKTDNVMVRSDGYVKILDFGIAKLAAEAEPQDTPSVAGNLFHTTRGLIVGSVCYMSPEQARGLPVDRRTDIFSLGVVLYELVTGRRAFQGETPSDCLAAVLEREPLPVSACEVEAPPQLEQVINKALQKDREQRYQRAEDFLQDIRELQDRSVSRDRKYAGISVRVGSLILAVVALLAVLAGIYPHRHTNNSASASRVPDKSIAVLPFESLSDDKANAYFADGMQDEILTDLAKINELRVISRTSVLQYKGNMPRDVRKIGEQLGVAHIVEGSVQRANGKVRINAQLIDARNDAHLWAQTYDGDLADIFAIQTTISKAIADQLQAKLSPTEKVEIERPPTSDLPAFDLYTRAKTVLLSITFNALVKDNLLQGIALLDEATRRDPNFYLAYCQLAWAHGIIYLLTDDHTPARRALADAAVQNVVRLRPEAGETHLVLAEYYYRCYRDYDRARTDLAVAQKLLPNDPKVFELTGYIDRRQGRWDQSAQNLERALQRDPRNFFILQQISLSYHYLRRYHDMAAALDRALSIAPGDIDSRVTRAYVDLEEHADPRPLHNAIHAIIAEDPKAAEGLADQWLYLALCEHDPTEAQRALAAIPPTGIIAEGVTFSRTWCEALAARARADQATEHDLLMKARAEQEQVVKEQPDHGPPLCVLGLIDAALGRKPEAIAEGRRAVELLPVTKDSVPGAKLLEYLAVIYAWCDEKALAVDQLKLTLSKPGDLSYGNLRLHPNWDPIRGDSQFEQLVASLAPKGQ